MVQVTKNFGTFKAIFVGPAQPTNTDILWKDTASAGVFKFFNTDTSTWVEIAGSGGGGGLETIAFYNPAATIGNEQSTGIITLANVTTHIRVIVSGYFAIIGSADKTKDCYFSSDGGITPKSIANIIIGDELYWNGIIADVDLLNSDDVTIYIL